MKHFEGNPYPDGSRGSARLLIGLLLFEVCVSVLRTAAASCSEAPGGLVGWWPADGNANNIVGADHGSLQGGATANVPGVVGLAFSFDGRSEERRVGKECRSRWSPYH